MTIDVIISRYNEDLKWTTEGIFNNFKYIVYNKGDNEDFEKANVIQVVNLPNFGRSTHTYLHHIITNYNNLGDIQVFLPGSLDLEYKKNKAAHMLRRIYNDKNAVFIGEYTPSIYSKFKDFKLDSWLSSSVQNATKNNQSKLVPSNIRPFGNWYKYYFGNQQVQFFAYWDVFSIDKRDIVQHPISRYIILMKQNSLDKISETEAGHYFERSWCAVFHPMKHTKKIMEPYY
jgi:hypothetical protein